MARKFKIGDVVQVVKDIGKGSNESLSEDFKVGHRGIVIGYWTGVPYSYQVE